MKYECFIKPGFRCQNIEADNAESARRQFAELIRDNLEAEHIIADNLDTEDGEDPAPNAGLTGQQKPEKGLDYENKGDGFCW